VIEDAESIAVQIDTLLKHGHKFFLQLEDTEEYPVPEDKIMLLVYASGNHVTGTASVLRVKRGARAQNDWTWDIKSAEDAALYYLWALNSFHPVIATHENLINCGGHANTFFNMTWLRIDRRTEYEPEKEALKGFWKQLRTRC
jgi:hypothetical protein